MIKSVTSSVLPVGEKPQADPSVVTEPGRWEDGSESAKHGSFPEPSSISIGLLFLTTFSYVHVVVNYKAF